MSKAYKRLGIAFLLIILLVLAVVATLYFMHQPSASTSNLPEFNLSLSSSNGTVMQGNSIQTSVEISNFRGQLNNITLSGNGNYSGVDRSIISAIGIPLRIQCNFEPISGNLSFTSNLTMNVPSSIPTNYYLVNVTATNGQVTHNTFYTLGVLSAKVLVSGLAVQPGNRGIDNEYDTQIDFTDISTGTKYSSGIDIDGRYSISLDNQHTYNTTITFNLIGKPTYPFIQSTHSSNNLRSVIANAPVGYNTMNYDLTS